VTMKNLNFAFLLLVISTTAMGQSNCILTKCGDEPSYLLLDAKDSELKKVEEIFARYNKCVNDCDGDKKAKAELIGKQNSYVKEKEDLVFCEKMLPKVLKDSYDEKILGVTNITKKSPTSKELNLMVMDRVKEKKALCQSHLDGKFDKEIYPKKMSELKFCFERMKDARESKEIKKDAYDEFQKVKTFLSNRTKKIMMDSSRSADLLNVQNKLEDCQKNLAESENLPVAKVNQAGRGGFKAAPTDEMRPGTNFHPNSLQK
jgi:hypothetical protein